MEKAALSPDPSGDLEGNINNPRRTFSARGTRIGAPSTSSAPATRPPGKGNVYLLAGFTLLLVVLIVLWYTAPAWEGSFGLGPKPSPSPQSYVSLNITEWDFHGPNACWQVPVFSNGGTVILGGTFQGSVSLPYPGGSSGPDCTAESVQVETSGFVLQNTNAPVTVGPGGSERLFVNVTVPDSVYTGSLPISITTVSP